MEKTRVNNRQRLINALLLHSSFIDNPGLLNGKMGISICFYHLARQTENSIYEDYAGELVDEIYEDITMDTPLDFASGLAGIGWGIEYLVQNNFIEADTDEVLEEIDKRLMPLIYSFPSSIGLENGLVGLGAYLLKRIQNPAANEEKIQTLINRQLLVHLISELDRRTQDVSELIKEPLHQPATEKEPDPAGEEKAKITKETTVFDLTWDYPVLLVFLQEVLSDNLYNVKVNELLQRLIFPLTKEENHPRLHSNRLLLALALTKLNQQITQQDRHPDTGKETGSFYSGIGMEKIIRNLLTGISRETIGQELHPNCAFLRNGTMGIAWIYQQLSGLTLRTEFKAEADYWQRQSFETNENNGLDWSSKEEVPPALGILEGYAGLILMESCHEKD